MPNYIKYSTTTQTLALKSGDYYIGTGDVRKGPTSTTDYWSCIIPPTSGYTVYLNKASNGPSIYTCNNDTDLINITNRIASQSYTSATECLVYYLGQNDKLCANIDYPTIVTNGLVLDVDAGFVASYPRSGTTWYDLTSNSNNGTLTNGPTFNSDNNGSIVFDGSNDIINFGNNNLGIDVSNKSMMAWVRLGSIAGISGIIDKDFDNGGADYGGWGFWVGSDRKLWWWVQGNQDIRDNGAASVGTNTWSHIAVVWNESADNARFFINGTLNSSRTNTNAVEKSSGTANLVIGAFRAGPGGGQAFVNGRIANALVYNRILSDSEVLQNYNATKARFGL